MSNLSYLHYSPDHVITASQLKSRLDGDSVSLKAFQAASLNLAADVGLNGTVNAVTNFQFNYVLAQANNVSASFFVDTMSVQATANENGTFDLAYDEDNLGNDIVYYTGVALNMVATHLTWVALKARGVDNPYTFAAADIVVGSAVTGAVTLVAKSAEWVTYNISSWWNNRQPVDVRFVSENEDWIEGHFYDYSGLPSDADKYVAVGHLIGEMKSNLNNGTITFRDEDGDQFGETYHVYNGKVLQQIADAQDGISFDDVMAAGTGAAAVETNAYNYRPNEEGDPYLYFSDEKEAVIYVPVRQEDGSIETYKAHAVYENGSVAPENLLFGEEPGIFDGWGEDTYNLILGSADGGIILNKAEELFSGEKNIYLGSARSDIILAEQKGDIAFGGAGIDALAQGGSVQSSYGELTQLIGGADEDHYGVYGRARVADATVEDYLYVNNIQVTGGIKDVAFDAPVAWNVHMGHGFAVFNGDLL